MSTQPNSGGAARKQHRGRKPYPISLKLDIIEKYDSGMKMSDIAKVAGIANSTVTTTVRDRNLIKAAAAKELTGGKPSKTPSKTSRLLAEMERLLDRWIHDMKEQDKPPSFTQIQEKAFSILRAIEKRTGTRIKTFTASADWYKEFKKRLGIDHRKRMAEAFQLNLRKIIEKGDYLPEQIFNVAKTDLFWRRMPAQKDSNEDEIRIPGLLGEEDRILLSFGGNVSGDCKLKPLAVYHASKPGAIKDFEGLTEMKEAERKCREIVDVVEVAISKEIVETCAEVKTRDDEVPVEDTNVEEEPKQGEPTDRHALFPHSDRVKLEKWFKVLKMDRKMLIRPSQQHSTHSTNESFGKTGQTVPLRSHAVLTLPDSQLHSTHSTNESFDRTTQTACTRSRAVPALSGSPVHHQNKVELSEHRDDSKDEPGSPNYMDEDTNSTYDQDGSIDEISIKEENNLDDFSVFVNEDVTEECKEKEQEEEQDPLGELQCPQDDNSNQDCNRLPGNNFKYHETLKLLEIYKRKLPELKSRKITMGTYWQEIEKEMQACGFACDGDTCSKKMGRLKRSYKYIKKNCKTTRSSWKYFEIMDDIFGDSFDLEKTANPDEPETEQPSTSATGAQPRTLAESPSTPTPTLTPASERTLSCPPSPVYMTTSPSPPLQPTPVAAPPPTKMTGAQDPAAVPESSNKRKRTEDPTNDLGYYICQPSNL
ncbi:putative tigger transposable element-derived protein 1-like [Penaeus vannamei]|uniref:Putative tigger transposable element-derived protein 1-like n=1 Tax=Penaeus vannamei TaxID=6689 RepID=A0A3R7QW23_PENVA|nr:putative tigger transposable element-derived protein 1-like [Penaeus vannamei]